MNMKIFKILILIALSFGCSLKENQNIIEKALPFEDTLVASEIVALSDNSELLRPFRILNVNDNYLVISELLPVKIFKVFELSSAKFLYIWGKQGRGPNEFRAIPGDIMTSGNDLIIYDPIINKLRTFEVKDSSVIPKKDMILSYKDQLDPLNRIQRMNDTLFFVDYGTSIEKSNKEHVALKPNEEDTLFTFGEYPDSELKETERYFNFLKTNISKPDGSLFVVFYLYQNVIKIYNTKGDLVREIKIADTYIPHQQTEDYLYRSAASASEKYIYTLGLNNSSENLYESSDSVHKTSVEIFNWNGNQLYRAKFDRLISGFTISEKHSKIYAYSILEPQKLFIYDLPKL